MNKYAFTNSKISNYVVDDLFIQITEKNKNGRITNVITNSAQYGLIPQRDFFDKDIAVKENTNKYTIIKRGDFVYNPRKSQTAPFGPFRCYELEDDGIVSPLYSCLRPKDKNLTKYLLYYFESPAWHSYIYHKGATGGARHDRVAMSKKLLMNIPVNLPEKNERDKIVLFFETLDNLIYLQTQTVNSVIKIKNGIENKIFNREIYFDKNEWKDYMLGDLLIERNECSTGNEEVYSVSVNKGLVNQVEHLGRSYAADDTSNYNLVHPYDVVYTKSPTGEFIYGIVKQSNVEKNVIVSPFYGVFTPASKDIGYLIDAYFSSNIRAYNYLVTQVRKGAKNTINVTNKEFLNKRIMLPTDEEEISKIVVLIKNLNRKIDIERELLLEYQRIKKHMLFGLI